MRLLGLLIPTLLLAAPIPARAQHLPIRTYTTAEGLPDDRVRRILSDSRGFLWFCTAHALSRFDGSSFHSYGAEQGLTLDDVNNVLEMREDTYMLATSRGVVRFDPCDSGHRFVSLSDDGQGPSVTNYVLQDSRGGLWAGGFGGLFRLSFPEGRPRFGARRARVRSPALDRTGGQPGSYRGSGRLALGWHRYGARASLPQGPRPSLCREGWASRR